MPVELYWLTLTILMTALIWVPYIINRIIECEKGPFAAVWNPQPDLGPKAQWATRMMRAHSNAVENLVVFAPLVLILHQLGISNNLTMNVCAIYFFARVSHLLLYTFGVPLLRTIAFAVGCFCQLALVFTLLGII